MIPFTQYHLPRGLKSHVEFEPVSPAIQALADKLLAAGCKFESEVLTTGQVSLTVAGTPPGETEEHDIAIALCRNDYGFIARAVDKLVVRAANRMELKE